MQCNVLKCNTARVSCPRYNVGHVIVLALYSATAIMWDWSSLLQLQTWVSCPDVGPRLTSPALYLVPGKELISDQLIRWISQRQRQRQRQRERQRQRQSQRLLTSPALYLVPGKELIRDKTADHHLHQCSEETVAHWLYSPGLITEMLAHQERVDENVDQIRQLLAYSKLRWKSQENRHNGNTALHVLFTTCVHIFAQQLLRAGALPLLAALIGKLESGTRTCELLPVWEHFPTTADSYQLAPN